MEVTSESIAKPQGQLALVARPAKKRAAATVSRGASERAHGPGRRAAPAPARPRPWRLRAFAARSPPCSGSRPRVSPRFQSPGPSTLKPSHPRTLRAPARGAPGARCLADTRCPRAPAATGHARAPLVTQGRLGPRPRVLVQSRAAGRATPVPGRCRVQGRVASQQKAWRPWQDRKPGGAPCPGLPPHCGGPPRVRRGPRRLHRYGSSRKQPGPRAAAPGTRKNRDESGHFGFPSPQRKLQSAVVGVAGLLCWEPEARANEPDHARKKCASRAAAG